MRISRLIGAIVGGFIILILVLFSGVTPLTFVAAVNWGIEGWLVFFVIWAIGVIMMDSFFILKNRRRALAPSLPASPSAAVAAGLLVASKPFLPPAATTGGTKFCTACGFNMRAAARFCEKCGAKQN